MINSLHFNLGLKLRSTNVELIPRAIELYGQKLFQFIELYPIPGTFERTIKEWQSVEVMFTIHCPHSAHGFNLAQEACQKKNFEIFDETRKFADALDAKTIVVHGGNTGSLKEALRQLLILEDKRIFLENKPKVGINNEVCIGFSVEELKSLVVSAHLSGIVLDFGHAIYAANSLNKDPFEHIKEFLSLAPQFLHLGDGDRKSQKDIHFNFGKGNFDIPRILSYIPENFYVTIETPLDVKQNLKDFEADVTYLHQSATRSPSEKR